MEEMNNGMQNVPQGKRKLGFWLGFAAGLFVMLLLGAAISCFVVFSLLRDYGTLDYNAAGTQGEITVENMNAAPNPADLDYDRIDSKIRLLQKVINKNYLFDEDPEAVENSIYAGMMEGLGDPYSIYYTEEEYKKLTEDSSGTYSGIGALLQQNPETGICTIIKVFKGSPAEEAGLKNDDILFKVDGNEITGQDLDYFVTTYIRGEEGTDVEITVLRGDKLEEITMKVTRRSIDVPTVEYEMKENDTGYIQISEFELVTEEQFKEAVEALQAQGMKRLIIDLRNNPGGIVQTCVEMLDYMLPDGLLVYTAGRNGVGEKYYSDDGHEVNIPTVLLVNGNSASCSEIFAGAYKDFGRARLIGTQTFGKGIVQFVIPLGDGSAVKVTTQHYYTPNGFDLHGTGIAPDVEIKPEEGDALNGEHDAQLEKAMELLEKQ
ncbi:MAG: S41 family peptidase [Stomatobaculum sp.]|nr:S41 family peptidase [Stomatobaculum sp.]